MSGNEKPDANGIARALDAWFQPGDVFEVRVLGVRNGPYAERTLSGYFDYEHICSVAEEIAGIGNYAGAYVTVNPVNPDLLARACNRLKRAVAATADRDIVSRRWLLIDCDAVRPAGIPGSDAEHEKAMEVAQGIKSNMAALGWPDPVVTDSGNGAQLMYRVNLPADDGGLCKRVTEEVAKASTADVKVDLTVHNAARIWRLPGTWNRKGDGTADRPHRMARIVSLPQPLVAVTREMLEGVLPADSPAMPEEPECVSEIRGFDLDSWIREHLTQFGIAGPVPYDGGRKWILHTCPFNEAHTNKSAVLIQRANGAVGFKCHHDSCAGNNWRKLRETLEPGCYDRKAEDPGVDLSGIMAEAKGTMVEGRKDVELPVEKPGESVPARRPAAIPERLLNVPGFINEYTDYTMRTGQYPNRVLAFCSALAFLSFLTGRRIMDERNNRGNIYLVALANSGTGKDHPRKVNMNVAIQNGIGSCIAESFGSGEGLEDAMYLHPSMLFEIDEFDTVFNSLKYERDGRGESIMEKLLRFYGSSNGTYKMRKLAMRNADGRGDDDDRRIVNPHLVILGTAIPKFFYSALSERVLANGLIARCMVLDAGRRGHGRKPSVEGVPDSITRTIEIVSKYGQPGNLTDINASPMLVSAAGEADELLESLNEKYDCIYDRSEEKQQTEAMSFWARAFEKVCKLSMLYAISENPLNPQISADGVKWAADFAEYVTNQMLAMVDAYSFENMFDEKCRKAMRYIREASGRITHGALLKRMHESKEIFKQIMETLEESGTVTHDYAPTGGREAKIYRLT